MKSTYLQRSEYNDILHDYQNFLFDELIERIGGNKDVKKASKNHEKFIKMTLTSGEKITLDTKLKEHIILNAVVSDIDHEQEIDNSHLGEVAKSEFDVNSQFMNFLASHTGEFQQARSKGKIKIALYQALEKYLGMTNSKEELQKIILNNTWFFIDLIDSSVTKYAKTRIKKDRIEKVNENWNVPTQEFLPKNYTEKKVKKCIVTPFYTGTFQTENGFIDHYLETNKNIDWWYQNGEKNEVYFGIPYTEAIKESLSILEFPLHFIDYETYASAVPKIDGVGPHQHVVFQVSIHTMQAGGSMEHYEYLADQLELPEKLIEYMHSVTGDTGTYISWHASFEKMQNKAMATWFPKHAEYLNNMSLRMYDLEDIFKKDYMDYRFHGLSSIKKVLPVICPELNYNELDVQNGTMALDTWGRMILDSDFDEDIATTRKNLLEYCKLDTLAMVELYKKLI